LDLRDGNGGCCCTNHHRRRERCFGDKLPDPDTVDILFRVARGCRLYATGVEHSLGNFDAATPDGRKVAPEPVLDSPLARIVIEVVTLPIHEGVAVGWIILRIDELDRKAVACGILHSDVENFKGIVRVDGHELDFFVGMVFTSAVCHLKLNGSGEVIPTIPLHLVAFDFVELACGEVRPVGLVYGGRTLDIGQDVVSPVAGVVSDALLGQLNCLRIRLVPRSGVVHEELASSVTGDHEAIFSSSGGFEPACRGSRLLV
jgi:hypothetical protein